MGDDKKLEEKVISFDNWVTELVDLVPASVYIPTDYAEKAKNDSISKSEKRRLRLNPDTAITTSMKILQCMMADAPTEESAPRSTENDALRPSDLKEKFDDKLAEIRANQKRDLPKTPRTEEEQRIVSEKRKAERERKKAKKQKLKTKVKEIVTADQRANQSPRKEPVENGKVIFNKFDLIKDPLEAEKEKRKNKKSLQVRLKEAEIKEARLEQLEETNPEKAEAVKEKIKWKNAMTRMKGEKVKDDANLLKRSLKRVEKKKEKSTAKWAQRTEQLQEKIKAKQDKRKTNLKERSMKKKGGAQKKKSGSGKKKTPGF
ncbi:unnamed protein product [Oikopleura dioica]|uniref:Ribosomal RNA-processing protein 14/surfeit locus protein 6 C-terminal domain-containing protein n=1 Tax=Oikopleura dioica TaxID=34765 RepID=E4WRE2_OIKDI|nr:unnamed protein product [Oikopleura dioica]CBY35393.1 unnamed protein product [Oikopleura dioica]